MMLIEDNANAVEAMINVRKLIAQLLNATVVVQKLPSVKGQLRLVTRYYNKENEKNDENNEDDEFFFKEPGKKKASKVSKPFCSKCNITIENHRLKDKHCLKCGTILLFKCMTCRTQYTSYRGMQMHLKTKCDETTLYIQCSVCDYATNSKLALSKHIKYVHQNLHKEIFEEFNPDQSNFKCPICHKMFKYRSNLTNHLKACKTKQTGYLPDNENTLKSSENKPTFNKLNLESNLIGYSVKYQIKTKTQSLIKYRCLKCNKTKKGMSGHHSPRCGRCNTLLSLSCKKCSKQYQNYVSLKYHLQSKCSPAAFYQCSKCSYKSTIKDLMNKHIKNMHIVVKDPKCSPQECPKCSAVMKNSMSLVSHLKYCGMKPNLFCKLCSYKTRFKQNLKKHLIFNHSGINQNNFINYVKDLRTKNIAKKPRAEVFNSENKELDSSYDISNILNVCCPTCKKETETSENIGKKCSNCESTFFFKCKKCGRPLSNYFNAKTHVRSCLAINLTLCKYCKKQIDGYDKFKRHLKYCESKTLYKCQYCFYQGKGKSDMHIHEKRCKRIRSAKGTKIVEPIKKIEKTKSDVEDKEITSKMETDEIVQETQDDDKDDGLSFKINGIDIIRKQITEHVPKINEIASRHCRKCKRVYEGSKALKNFCSYCKNIELYHQCQKCKKRYNHTTSLIFHLKSVCFPTTQYTCSVCNYSNNMRSIIMKHARHSKHTIMRH